MYTGNTMLFKNKPGYFTPFFILNIVIFTGLLTGTYYSALQRLFFYDWTKQDYSHCIIIPFIVLYLIGTKSHHLDNAVSKPSYNGFFFMAASLFLYWVGELAGEFYTLYFSLWLFTFSLCFLYLGWEKLKIILFPLLFSLTMFPFPNFINNRITLQLKLISTKIGVIMMQTIGLSAFREGNVIDIGYTKLQVVDACSGLRYLFPMTVLSLLVAYLLPVNNWKKGGIVLSSVPLTILSNSLRIALTGVLSAQFGLTAIEGFFHDFEGWLIFMLTIAFIYAEIWVLNTLFPEKVKQNVCRPAPESVPWVDKKMVPQKTELIQAVKKPHFIVPAALLVLTLFLSHGVTFREKMPVNKSFSSFPLNVKGWKGIKRDMETKFIEELDFSDYFMADYSNPAGNSINLYIAYYESQQKGESIHSPASCLRGGGWSFNQSGTKSIDLKNGTQINVNRALIEKPPVTQLSYYWFPSRGRNLTNAIEMKLFNFWDALTKQRTDGALVRIITTVSSGESIGAAEKRMQSFVELIAPGLTEYLPQ